MIKQNKHSPARVLVAITSSCSSSLNSSCAQKMTQLQYPNRIVSLFSSALRDRVVCRYMLGMHLWKGTLCATHTDHERARMLLGLRVSSAPTPTSTHTHTRYGHPLNAPERVLADRSRSNMVAGIAILRLQYSGCNTPAG